MFASRYRALCLGLAAGLVWICSVRADSQDPKLAPLSGSVTLNAGFLPDPHKVMVTAGGPIETKLGGFTHFVAKAPDFRLTYKAGTFPLIIHAESKGDATLLINLPDGTWVGNDDANGTLNPMLKFDKPQSGVYDIFVGTIGNQPEPATLLITEIPIGAGGVIIDKDKKQDVKKEEAKKVDGPDHTLPPAKGSANLKAGFTPDPHTVKVTAGGPVKTNLGDVDASVGKAPDFRLNYTAGAVPLTFRAESDATDTTLLIRLPNGTWLADDDSGGGTNSLIRIAQPASGVYDIWVGAFGDAPPGPATLFITEAK